MVSIMEGRRPQENEDFTEEVILYDLINRLITQAEILNTYEEVSNAFKAYASIKAILILFEFCGLEIKEGYWAWVHDFYEEIKPKCKTS